MHDAPESLTPAELDSIARALDFMAVVSHIGDRTMLPICADDRSSAPLRHLARKVARVRAATIRAHVADELRPFGG